MFARPDSMSTSPETDFDLEKLFLPAWAQESPTVNRYAKHPGDDRPERRFDDRQGGRRPPPRRDDRGGDRRDRPERRETPPPLPALLVTFLPDDKGVESLSRQIKISGRSFPLFDIAQMILQKPERHLVRFEIEKKPDGQPIQPLFVCAIDDTPWLSEEEAVGHVLERHFGMFYNAEKTPTDPPKGVYTFVAQCGMSGV